MLCIEKLHGIEIVKTKFSAHKLVEVILTMLSRTPSKCISVLTDAAAASSQLDWMLIVLGKRVSVQFVGQGFF